LSLFGSFYGFLRIEIPITNIVCLSGRIFYPLGRIDDPLGKSDYPLRKNGYPLDTIDGRRERSSEERHEFSF
jgi:hypothetical protein